MTIVPFVHKCIELVQRNNITPVFFFIKMIFFRILYLKIKNGTIITRASVYHGHFLLKLWNVENSNLQELRLFTLGCFENTCFCYQK